MGDRHFEQLETNGVTLRAVVEGEGPLIILLHGWPQCWYLWRNQIDPLVAAGFRVAAPDQRGYGGSECPAAIEDYNILKLAGDVVGLADALGEERFHLVGHDWGCIVAWHTALLYPHRLRCVTGLSVPYVRAKGDSWVNPPGRDEAFWYIRYFQTPGVAEAEFEADIRKSLATMYYYGSADARGVALPERPRDARFFDGYPPVPGLPRGLTQADLDYYVEQFSTSGFRGGFNWYRNFSTIAPLTPWLDEARIQVPAHFIAGEKDGVLRFFGDFMKAQEPWFSDLRGATLIPEAGHWVQQEQPEATTKAILAFVATIQGAG